MCDDSSAAEGLPMDLLARRIQQMSEELSTARLFILDAMVPGQRLSFAAPAAMVETLRSSDQVVMFGVDPRQRSLCTHGVSVMLDEVEERDDGDFDVVLTAGRMCALADLGEDEGSRWKGREAQVRWVSLDAPDETEDAALLERSAALEKLVDEWASLVRAGRVLRARGPQTRHCRNHPGGGVDGPLTRAPSPRVAQERTPGQLDGVIRDLGPMPDADAPSARALWIGARRAARASASSLPLDDAHYRPRRTMPNFYRPPHRLGTRFGPVPVTARRSPRRTAGLINPLPALGVALEIRPAAVRGRVSNLSPDHRARAI